MAIAFHDGFLTRLAQTSIAFVVISRRYRIRNRTTGVKFSQNTLITHFSLLGSHHPA